MNDTCYTGIKCDYLGPLPTCLDWREVCDGKIDCLNGRIDEQNCFELESNECNNDEYRCHNGRCILAIFYRDDPVHSDCLDRSDKMLDYSEHCFRSSSIRCKELTCRLGYSSYPCGDGQSGQWDHGRDGKLMFSFTFQPKEPTFTDDC